MVQCKFWHWGESAVPLASHVLLPAHAPLLVRCHTGAAAGTMLWGDQGALEHGEGDKVMGNT